MSVGIVIFAVDVVVLRGLTLAISFRNDRRLRREGAVEYGKGGTILLTGVSLRQAFSVYHGVLGRRR